MDVAADAATVETGTAGVEVEAARPGVRTEGAGRSQAELIVQPEPEPEPESEPDPQPLLEPEPEPEAVPTPAEIEQSLGLVGSAEETAAAQRIQSAHRGRRARERVASRRKDMAAAIFDQILAYDTDHNGFIDDGEFKLYLQAVGEWGTDPLYTDGEWADSWCAHDPLRTLSRPLAADAAVPVWMHSEDALLSSRHRPIVCDILHVEDPAKGMPVENFIIYTERYRADKLNADLAAMGAELEDEAENEGRQESPEEEKEETGTVEVKQEEEGAEQEEQREEVVERKEAAEATPQVRCQLSSIDPCVLALDCV